MNKNLFLIIMLLGMVIQIIAQLDDKTQFSSTDNNLCRYSTSQKDLEAGIFLPQYNELASNPNDGVTLDDWKNSSLSLERFFILDEDGNNIISREEMDKDIAMGSVKSYEQTLDTSKFSKKFPEYSQIFRKMDANQKPEEKIVFFISNSISDKTMATKNFIQLRQGKAFQKRVDLTEYALLQLEDRKDRKENTITLYLYTFLFLAVIAAISFAILITNSPKQKLQSLS